MLRDPNVYFANKFSIKLFLIVWSFAFLWSSDAAVVVTCIAVATGAVGVYVAHHAPAGVGVADAFATTTFIVRGTGSDTAVVVACIAITTGAVIIDIASHAHAGVNIADSPSTIIVRGAVSSWKITQCVFFWGNPLKPKGSLLSVSYP